MPRQIATGYQPPSPIDLEARVHSLELQVAYLTEAVQSLTGSTAEAGAGRPGD
ncbi:hypothetical protein [Sphaerisporangium fuscum]|uniref:hypothetical protein n=1 Tax=Sphaerisporangium fuscum TaxID=2835868 RepID=UPI001BDC6FE0|nr:hypothetical protein [Sphaerisporangium fuscum]